MNQPRTERGSHASTRALGALLLCIAASGPLRAQTHKVAAPENVVRAVGVYEWTGDMAKPVASRLIPVSLFIDSKFEDADVYLARPVPFALDTGNVYELDRAGIALGTLDLAFARHLVASDTATTTLRRRLVRLRQVRSTNSAQALDPEVLQDARRHQRS